MHAKKEKMIKKYDSAAQNAKSDADAEAEKKAKEMKKKELKQIKEQEANLKRDADQLGETLLTDLIKEMSKAGRFVKAVKAMNGSEAGLHVGTRGG